MTFTIRTRGAGSYLMCEYACPVHGIFEALVTRDANGDAPDEQACPARAEFPSLKELRTRVIDFKVPTCNRTSPWTISSTNVQNDALKVRAVSLGGDMKERPAGMLDTRPLAEGMKMSEWKKIQRDKQRERRHQQLVSKGIRKKRIQVGGG